MPRPSVRHLIVESALRVLHGKGFHASSVQDITEAAGVPKGSFYNHFKSKEELAVEILDIYGKESRIDLLFAGEKPPLARLRSHFEFVAERLKRGDFDAGCLLGNFSVEMADSVPAMRKALGEALVGWTEAVASVLRQAQAEGDLDPSADAVRLARFLINAWEGAVARTRVTRDAVPFDDFFVLMFGFLLVPAPEVRGKAAKAKAPPAR